MPTVTSFSILCLHTFVFTRGLCLAKSPNFYEHLEDKCFIPLLNFGKQDCVVHVIVHIRVCISLCVTPANERARHSYQI